MRVHALMFALALSAAAASAASAEPPRAAVARSARKATAPSEKMLWLGPEASYANESNLGVGARALWSVPEWQRVGLITSFDYFFPGGTNGAITTDAKHWEVNGNVAYHFGRKWRPYVGPGLNVARRSAELSFLGQTPASTTETSLGLNLLGGVRRVSRGRGGRQYFAEARKEIKGGEQLLVSAGVLF